MTKENVFYTDTFGVTVTDSELQVRKKWYSLDGITKHGLAIIRPSKAPGILLLFFGAILTIAGGASVVGNLPEVTLVGVPIDPNTGVFCLGVLFMLTGIGIMWSMREKYAVSITIATGDRVVVISNHKEYITQIVHALNEAFFSRIHKSTFKGPQQQFTASAR